MTVAIDEGAILAQRSFEVSERETAFSLDAKRYEAAIGSFAGLVEALAAERKTPREQSQEGRSYFGRYQWRQAQARGAGSDRRAS